ncbi:DUF4376 domain-containing protein [Stenotrophomonas maltophilia]|uniref:DUF4376 domain-containing protein n=1 Tax=Stenotrophomonas maltophilia TaxID=40324 RepID=UPI0015590342|nr:DUF4376 domain-containing protein [Stenotrophomonas maltophilia]
MRFSRSTGGFYDDAVHVGIPTDAVEVSEELYAELMEGQAAGKSINVDEDGLPCLAEDAPRDLERERRSLLQRVTAERWKRETGGIQVGGVHIATAVEDQNRINSVLSAADLGCIESVDFKAESGWISVPVGELREIAVQVALHVQRCFSAEMMHHRSIAELGTLEEIDRYDLSTGWPD